MFCWLHLGIIIVNKQLDAHFLFISILYMFRVTMCSSSGESIVSIRRLAYVILYRWTSGMQVSIPAYQTVTYTEWHMPDVVLIQLVLLMIQLILLMMSTWLLETCRERLVCSYPYLHTRRSPTQSDIRQMSYWYNWFFWWWAHGCSKHVEYRNKHIWERIVLQVGYLQKLKTRKCF